MFWINYISFSVGRVNTLHFKLTFKEKCHLPSTTSTRTLLQIRFTIYLVNLNSCRYVFITFLQINYSETYVGIPTSETNMQKFTVNIACVFVPLEKPNA